MRKVTALTGALALALALLSLAAAPVPTALSQPPRVTALVGGRLIDGYGGRPIENSVVLIAGDRIQAVGRVGEIAVPEGAEVISTEGMSVLPGLWDMHVHLMIVGHADYGHWDKTYPKLFRGTIMPAAARQLLLAAPPAKALPLPGGVAGGLLALRVHVDDSTSENGPLRVLPDTHQLGRLSESHIAALASVSHP